MKIDAPLPAGVSDVADRVGRLEQAGFNGLYSADGPMDAFVSVASASTFSKRADLFTAIAVAYARNPMNVAYMSNDLQNLAGGRFMLGLGTQIKPHIERRFSMPWSKPVSRMREFVLALRAIWHSWETGERLNFDGEFYTHTLMNPVFTPPVNTYGYPKIFVAGVGPKMTEAAAEVGDGFLGHPFNSQDTFDSLTLPALKSGLSKAGKSIDGFDVTTQIITAIGLDEESLQGSIMAAKNQIAFYGSTPAYLPILDIHGWGSNQKKWHKMTREGDWASMMDSVSDEMLETFAVVGKPEEVARQIKARYEGKMDRISPIIYDAKLDPLLALRDALGD